VRRDFDERAGLHFGTVNACGQSALAATNPA
jgi:hypothetical protein